MVSHLKVCRAPERFDIGLDVECLRGIRRTPGSSRASRTFLGLDPLPAPTARLP